MSDENTIAAKPYTVSYMKDGVRHTIRRTPPPKQHNLMPQDQVSLLRKKNDDYLPGAGYTVKGFNPRHPNVLQIENSQGDATFVSFHDLSLEKSNQESQLGMNAPERNRYLLWP